MLISDSQLWSTDKKRPGGTKFRNSPSMIVLTYLYFKERFFLAKPLSTLLLEIFIERISSRY